MKITYRTLDQNHTAINTLAEVKTLSFGTKIKIVKIQKWLTDNSEILTKFMKEIEEEFDIKNRFEFDEDGKFIGENLKEVQAAVFDSNKKQLELLAVLIDSPTETLEPSEIEDAEVSANEITQLTNLGILIIE